MTVPSLWVCSAQQASQVDSVRVEETETQRVDWPWRLECEEGQASSVSLPLRAQVWERGNLDFRGLLRPEGVFYWRGPCSESSPRGIRQVVGASAWGRYSWTIKRAEHQRIDAFELRCWRRLLRVPWTARRPNPSILEEISPEYSSEGLRLKLKRQSSGHPTRKTDSRGKTLMEGRRRPGRPDRRREAWMASRTGRT